MYFNDLDSVICLFVPKASPTFSVPYMPTSGSSNTWAIIAVILFLGFVVTDLIVTTVIIGVLCR